MRVVAVFQLQVKSFPSKNSKKCAAAGGNIRDLIGNIKCVNCSHCVAAARNRKCSVTFCNGFGYDFGSLCKLRNFKHTYRTVPHNCASILHNIRPGTPHFAGQISKIKSSLSQLVQPVYTQQTAESENSLAQITSVGIGISAPRC